MKALTYQRYGTPDVLSWSEVAQPVPGAHDVLIQVRAASLNHADLLILHGTPRIARLMYGVRRPKATILGRDVAGTVTAVGPRVTGLRPGDEVFGEAEQRGFAEYVSVPAAHLAVKPPGVSFADAATLPVAATTALQALRLAGTGPGKPAGTGPGKPAGTGTGKTVLVNGASGGVGTFAVQLARSFGATVTGVCGTRNTDLVRGLGAERVIDYTREDVTATAERFDAVIDLAGSHPLARMRRLLTPDGVYVAATGNGGPVLGPMPRLLTLVVTAPFVGPRLRTLAAKRSVEDLDLLAGLVERGEITPVIERTYPLPEAAGALWHLEREHARGKIVLSP